MASPAARRCIGCARAGSWGGRILAWLALIALLLPAVAGLAPMPAAAASFAPDAAGLWGPGQICTPTGAPARQEPENRTGGSPVQHQPCQICLTLQVAGSFVMPALVLPASGYAVAPAPAAPRLARIFAPQSPRAPPAPL